MRLFYVPCPDVDTAKKIAMTLVEERKVACANILPQVQSIYRWEDKIESSTECILLLKTTDLQISSVESKIKEMHPYQVPCLLSFEDLRINSEFEDWLQSSVK